MKIRILFILLLAVSCSDKQPLKQVSESEKSEKATIQEIVSEKTIRQNLLKEFPDHYKVSVTEGKLDSDSLTDYFYILTPDFNKEKRRTSKFVLIFGHYKNDEPRKIVFEDLLPEMSLFGKIDSPFDTFRLRKVTLLVTFLSNEYEHDEFYMKSYTFRFIHEQNFFSLLKSPKHKNTFKVKIDENELVNRKLPFSYSNWSFYSPDNVSISKNAVPKWGKFSAELKQIELEWESKNIEEILLLFK